MKNEALIGSVRSLIEDCLRGGSVIDIDGIGTLEIDASGELVFKRNGRVRLFIAYAKEDRVMVTRLYHELQNAGFEPWMDVQNLLPGQNWPRAIKRAIELSNYFIGCFSPRSINKRGHFQAELAHAMNVAGQVPTEQVYFIPVRLAECEMPGHIEKSLHYVDLYPDWTSGIDVMVRAILTHEKTKPGV